MIYFIILREFNKIYKDLKFIPFETQEEFSFSRIFIAVILIKKGENIRNRNAPNEPSHAAKISIFKPS